jgi:uncharacterized protein (TIGR03437 family)
VFEFTLGREEYGVFIHQSVRPAVITIRGQPTKTPLSGLTPGFFGLYQANFEMTDARGVHTGLTLYLESVKSPAGGANN